MSADLGLDEFQLMESDATEAYSVQHTGWPKI